MSPALQVAFPVACALLHIAYGVADVALAKASPPVLEARAGQGDRAAAAAIEQNADENRQIAAGLLGTSFVGALGVAMSAGIAGQVGGAVGGAAAYIAALAILDAALPRVIGPDAALTLAGPSARLLRATQLALYPLVLGIGAWANAVSRALGSTRGTALTRQEIILLLDADKVLDPQEQDLIRRVLALPETPASACMTPIARVAHMPETATVAEVTSEAIRSGHSRLVIVSAKGALADGIVGVVHARDLLFAPDGTAAVRTRMRPLRRMLAVKPVHEVIRELRRSRSVMAVLVDDANRAVGIVTIEDLLEEIVGEMHDERDRTAPPPPPRT